MMGSFSSGPSIFAVFIVAALLCSSCKPKKVTTDSDIQTTGCPSSGAGQELRRTRAMPDFVKVSMPILKKIVSKTNSFNHNHVEEHGAEQRTSTRVFCDHWRLRNLPDKPWGVSLG
jgi:hypothetical protein